jgi:hypothetical protein
VKPAPNKKGWLLITHTETESSRTFARSTAFMRAELFPTILVCCSTDTASLAGEGSLA